MNTLNTNQSQSPEVIVVEASAGSGKTLALAKRYLQLLFHPPFTQKHTPLATILAITFTNKATIEMKERIIDLLKKIALGAFSNRQEESDILALLDVDKETAKKTAQRIVGDLIRHYDSFQIQTIDSFINALLVGCALHIDRSARFKIKQNYSKHLSYCLDSVIEQAVINKEVFNFLEDFLTHYLFVENRTSWFPKAGILELMHSLFSLSNKYGQLFGVYKEGKSQDIIKKKKYIYGKISELSGEFPKELNAKAKNYIHSFLQKSNQIFDIADLPFVFQSPQPPMNKGLAAPFEFRKKWEKIHNLLKELIELDANLSYAPYIEVFSHLLGFFQLISRKEDVLFLEELNRKARLLFDEGGLSVAEAYYRLATRFRHYLIDEFQDTSILQWQNLEMMVEEALSSGGSLFYVGDKKQAIYRFRGGEAWLFDDVRRRFKQFNVTSAQLLKNWRSQRAIVEFNNQTFSKDNLIKGLSASGIIQELDKDEQAISEILAVFKDAVQTPRVENDAGYVYLERIKERNQQERNQIMQPKLIKLVSGLKERFSYEDMAILTRDNNEVELITSWLLEAGYPVESEKTLNVIENPLIKEIILFLKFLYFPPDDLSFAGFIIGEIFSKATKVAANSLTDFIFSLHKNKILSTAGVLYRLFRQQFPDFWEQYIDLFFKSVGFVSVYELVASIYQRFNILENFKTQQAFFMKFLELIKQKEDEYIGLGEFIAYLNDAALEDLYVKVIHSDSIKILTIHKAKGLEFPVVIVPFLRMDINPETGGKGANSYVINEPEGFLRLIRITKVHRNYSQLLKNIYTESYKKACIDELNNIYVALTRAKFELYVFLPQGSAAAKNKAHFFIPQITQKGQQKAYREIVRDKPKAFIKITASFRKDWLKELKEEFPSGLAVSNRESILKGTIMHAILSQIPNCQDQDFKKILKDALAYAKIKFPFLKNISFYEDKIRTLISSSQLKDIFYTPDSCVFCEKEIVNNFGDLKRIDRLIVRKDKVLIIDYKSSHENKKDHIEQVAEYMKIIKDIYPQHKIEGFLVYWDKALKEEVSG